MIGEAVDYLPNDCLFVYGTLRRGARHAMSQYLYSHATYLGNGSILAEMYDFGSYPGAFADEQSESRILGDVCSIHSGLGDGVLEQLDDYEGCGEADPPPHLYRRRKVTVEMDNGKSISAWAYLLPMRPFGRVRITGGDYLAWLRRK